jgi:drug/metabolite transporter (DMT)-like permease
MSKRLSDLFVFKVVANSLSRLNARLEGRLFWAIAIPSCFLLSFGFAYRFLATPADDWICLIGAALFAAMTYKCWLYSIKDQYYFRVNQS